MHRIHCLSQSCSRGTNLPPMILCMWQNTMWIYSTHPNSTTSSAGWEYVSSCSDRWGFNYHSYQFHQFLSHVLTLCHFLNPVSLCSSTHRYWDHAVRVTGERNVSSSIWMRRWFTVLSKWVDLSLSLRVVSCFAAHNCTVSSIRPPSLTPLGWREFDRGQNTSLVRHRCSCS